MGPPSSPSLFLISAAVCIPSLYSPYNTSYGLTSTTCNTSLPLIPTAVYFQLPAMRIHLSIPPHQLRLVFLPPTVYFHLFAIRVLFFFPLHQLRFALLFFLLQFSFFLSPYISCSLYLPFLQFIFNYPQCAFPLPFFPHQRRFSFNHLQWAPPPLFFSYWLQFAHPLLSLPNTNYDLTSTTYNASFSLTPAAVYF